MSSQQQYELAQLTGHGFAVNEVATIRHQARLLADTLKHPHITLWGKVYGARSDYILLRCTGRDLLATTNVVLYSVDGGLTFHSLRLDDDSKDVVCALVRGPYVGDAAYEYKVNHPTTGLPVTLRESERLSWFVRSCDAACRVVPRGAVLEYENGTVTINKAFEGLEREAAGRTDSYVHLRTQRRNTTALERDGTAKKLDFLDAISYDEPRAIWSLKYEPTQDAVYGLNMLYLGALFYHIPESNVYGSVYMGDGDVNTNMAFML